MQRTKKIIHAATAHRRHIFGTGITCAVLDTGVLPTHPDLRGQLAGFLDFTRSSISPDTPIRPSKEAYDDSGHGTHVCGILSGNGSCSNGMYAGVAPQARLIVLKILDKNGCGEINNFFHAIRWLLHWKDILKIRIVNISFGTTTSEHMSESSKFVRSVESLWQNGLVVLCAAGNAGPGSETIGSPGISRRLITVGSSGSPQRKNYSGRGPTASCIKKPDVVAPGSHILSCNGFYNPELPVSPKNYPYCAKNGTSMSTPMVSGAIALLLSQNPELTPKEIKLRLMERSDNLFLSHSMQGWGQLNISRLLL